MANRRRPNIAWSWLRCSAAHCFPMSPCITAMVTAWTTAEGIWSCGRDGNPAANASRTRSTTPSNYYDGMPRNYSTTRREARSDGFLKLVLCTPDQVRTGVTALRGRRPRPLDDGGWLTQEAGSLRRLRWGTRTRT